MIRVRITGLDEAERKLGPQLLAKPVRNFFERGTVTIQSGARERAPVDRGRLRNSIMRDIDPGLIPRRAAVGTDVFYAPYVHEGTRPHWPPVSALRGWARRHGMNPYLVARAIARRGTKPRPFLREAFEAALPEIDRLIDVMAGEIEREAQR